MNLAGSDSDTDFAAAWRYSVNPSFRDEMMSADGAIRPHWRALVDGLVAMGPAGLAARWREGLRLVHENGITYNVYGDPRSAERPWPVDSIPLIIEREEWRGIAAAVRQRATLLNAILGDLYGARRLPRQGLLPAELIYRHSGFLRPCVGLNPPKNIYLHVYAADLARSPDGQWWVIGDRTQAPSGAGYALENRMATTRALPDLLRGAQARGLARFFHAYGEMLRGLCPDGENPRLALLTPGPHNETFFEHALLARQLGFTLAEGADLTVRENRVYLKTLGGLLPIDVIVRRQDDSFCDPLELRADSMLGVAGLVAAARAGHVAIANALGSGLIESAALAAFIPGLCRHLLGEELRMPTVATWWCGESAPLEFVTSHLAGLVIKPAFPGRNEPPIFGARLGAAERRALAERMRAAPGDFVAQEQVSLSTVPVWADDRLASRHFVLRVFAVAAGDSYVVMPGGLTRVTNSLDSLVVSMQHGGGSKDTWVLGDGPSADLGAAHPMSEPVEISRATFELPSRVADNLFWLGRNVERVEQVVRVCRAALTRLNQDAGPAAPAGVAAGMRVLAALGHRRPGFDCAVASAAELEAALCELVYDVETPSGLGANLHQVRQLASLLRDRISADAWRFLNHLDQQFATPPPPEPLRTSGALNLLDHAIMTLSAFGGLVMESMTRGHGWRFLDIGRRLERAEQVVELIRAGIDFTSAADSGQLEAVLEIADSFLTYRSRYLASMRPDLVLDLLLLDGANPRSVTFQIARLREHLAHLPDGGSGGDRPAEWRLAARLLTEAQLTDAAELTTRGMNGGWSNPRELLARLDRGLRMLSDALTRVYFAHALATRQLAAR